MKIELTFLRSKVAQRIFFLFVSCALIPIAVLAVISQTTVSRNLRTQSTSRLHQASKNIGMEILGRFDLLQDEIKMIASNVSVSSDASPYYVIPEPQTGLMQRINSLMLIPDEAESRHLFGHISNPPDISPEKKEQIFTSEMSLLLTEHITDNQARIFMVVPLDPELKSQDLLLAELSPDFIWFMGNPDYLQMNINLSILDQSNRVLRSTLLPPISFDQAELNHLNERSSTQFEWAHRGKEYLTEFSPILLSHKYIAEDLKLLLSETKAVVLNPFYEFRRLFPLVALTSLWLVLFLSMIQIRRSLVPLEKLKEGTKRLAKREFDSRVVVTSHDEFEEVAESFNSMASQLGKQFKALATMGEIDRAILSVLDTEKIVSTLVARVGEVFPCKNMSIAVLDPGSTDTARVYIGEDSSKKEKFAETVKIIPEEMQTLVENPDHLLITLDENLPQYLSPLAKRGIKSFLVLPLFLKEGLAGIISLGYIKQPKFSKEDLDNARRLANQVAVAFSNARLIEQLSELNWGTLRALARTIDAKSPWTAGHSERSTQLAIKIGEAMGLSQEELDDIRRAGLLHDIGKLGIPPEILDKAGNLTSEEEELMRKHPSLGARILEPIAAYSQAIPIVLQHHEFFDGTGYPNGLMGEAICLGARIFIVADTHDALISDRPYRKALDRKNAIKYIKDGAGTKFDPDVVKAYLQVMTEEKKK